MTTIIDAPAPPPTPNCDRIDEGYNAIRAFMEYLGEQGLVIVKHDDLHKVIHKAVQAEVILAFRAGHSTYTEVEQKLEADRVASQITVERPDPQKLLDELYDVDQRELERERRALLGYSHQLHIQATYLKEESCGV